MAGNTAGGNTGIHNGRGGDATIIDSVIRHNEAWANAGTGGGIRNYGVKRVRGTRMYHNKVRNIGGGIYNAGDLRLRQTHIYRNEAQGAGIQDASRAGGGIFNQGTLKRYKVWMWNNTPNDCTGC